MGVSSNVNSFLQQVGQGVRSNLFQVSFYGFPNIIDGAGNQINLLTDTATYLCKSAALPSSNLGVIEVPFRGRQVKIVGDRTFDTWTATFINDTGFALRNAMEGWMAAMNSHTANTAQIYNPSINATNATNVPTNYTADIVVQQLARTGNADGGILRTYNLWGCFPTNVSQIDLSYDSNDQIEDFTVEFQMQYWTAAAGNYVTSGKYPNNLDDGTTPPPTSSDKQTIS
jgi:hypothetical protein